MKALTQALVTLLRRHDPRRPLVISRHGFQAPTAAELAERGERHWIARRAQMKVLDDSGDSEATSSQGGSA